MTPGTDNSAPLTLDEMTRLVVFLAERGHADTALRVMNRVMCESVMAHPTGGE